MFLMYLVGVFGSFRLVPPFSVYVYQKFTPILSKYQETFFVIVKIL